MRITSFAGVVPRVPDISLGLPNASLAYDVDLRNGVIRPWLAQAKVAEVSPTDISFHVDACCYHSWDTCVTVADWVPDVKRLYLTGRKDYPEVATYAGGCDLVYARLGIPTPEQAPMVSAISTPDKDKHTAARTYIYTYVNDKREESGPSYPSTIVDINDGQPVTVSGWGKPHVDYKVTSVRIYRTATGFRSGTEKEQEVTTDYLLVAEVDISTNTYVDTKIDLELGAALTTRSVMPPPNNLQQITAVEGTMTLCGFVGNKLYFTKNGEPHNWPSANEVTLDDNIAFIRENNGYLFVATSGTPYIIDAAECKEKACRAVIQAEVSAPAVACGFRSAATMTPFGMVYASTEGLALLSQNGTVNIITNGVFSGRDWRKLAPNTCRVAYYHGYVVCITDTVSFMLLMDRDNFAADSSAAMTYVSIDAVDVATTKNGELLYMSDGFIWQWGAGDTYIPYTWRTPLLQFSGHNWFTCGKIDTTNKVTMSLLDGKLNKLVDIEVMDDVVFRLPRLPRMSKYYIEVTGIGDVDSISVSQTMGELNG